MEPTTEDIRRTLAEFMGWDIFMRDGYGQTWVSSESNGHSLIMLPDYTNDLNAMHSVEQELEQRGKWIAYLEALIPKPQPNYADDLELLFGKAKTLWALIHATAEQRAKAAYAVIKAQKEVQHGSR